MELMNSTLKLNSTCKIKSARCLGCPTAKQQREMVVLISRFMENVSFSRLQICVGEFRRKRAYVFSCATVWRTKCKQTASCHKTGIEIHFSRSTILEVPVVFVQAPLCYANWRSLI